MDANTQLILKTLAIVPILWCVYVFVLFYLDFKRRAKHILKIPGINPHPLYGHLHYFPGPGEDGLKFIRDRINDDFGMRGFGMMFYGPFIPSVSVYHPDTVKLVLKTSGPGEDGLAFIRDRINESWGARGIGTIFYGPIYPSIQVFHPDTAKIILRTSEPKPQELGAYRFIKPWLGDGLLISRGHKWGRNRRLLTPAFHFDILKPYIQVNNLCAEKLMDKIEQFKGESFEVFTHISQCTLDIMFRCAFSYETDCQRMGDAHPYVKAVSEMGDIVVYRMLRPHLYPDLLFALTSAGRKYKKHCKFVHGLSWDIIKKRKETLASIGEAAMKSGKYVDFLDILLTAKDEEGSGLSDSEIRDEVDTFLFEGHDTTACGVSWTLYSLAGHPECQKRCQEEIDQILNEKGTDQIEWEDLPKLKFLAQCIKEAMRHHGVVPMITRQLTKDIYIEGYFIPAKTIVDVQIYGLHHNERVWENAMEYQPDRFSPENMQKMDSYAYVPFSAGPRNCIGQSFAMHEQKVVMARLLHRYNFTLDPDHKTEKRMMVVMKTENGMKMKATPRKSDVK